MNLRAVLLCPIVLLAFPAAAAANGPVFAVVPNAPAAPSEAAASFPVNAGSSVHSELSADRRMLAQVHVRERRAMTALGRAEAMSASSQLLSDQLDAERATAQLQLSADDSAAQASQLQQEIAALASELQPVAPSLFDPLASASAGSATGAEAVAIAEQYLGAPYRWGGADPLTGFDCSGLTMYVYAQLGVQLRHYAADQWTDLPHVDPAQLQPGDLVFFEPRWNGPGHVGIYTGGDSFIEAPHTGDVVKLASLSQEAGAMGFVGAARPAALTGVLPGF